jgi:sulfite exporter TauE/SafE
MNQLLLPALSMGLFGSIHCVTMCGSASSVLCAKKGRYSLAFNAGRVLGYVTLGFAAGAVGSWTVGHGIDGLRFAFRALAATTMLMVGLHLAGLPSFVRLFEAAGGPLWRRVAPIAARLVPLRTAWQALAAGALWALMPCGLLYAALATSASAYSAIDGAATMAAFAVGTLPLMLGVGALASRVAGLLQHGWLRRAAGGVVLAFGVWSTAGLAAQAGILSLGQTCATHAR